MNKFNFVPQLPKELVKLSWFLLFTEPTEGQRATGRQTKNIGTPKF